MKNEMLTCELCHAHFYTHTEPVGGEEARVCSQARCLAQTDAGFKVGAWEKSGLVWRLKEGGVPNEAQLARLQGELSTDVVEAEPRLVIDGEGDYRGVEVMYFDY